jgi:hypothetical protein
MTMRIVCGFLAAMSVVALGACGKPNAGGDKKPPTMGSFQAQAPATPSASPATVASPQTTFVGAAREGANVAKAPAIVETASTPSPAQALAAQSPAGPPLSPERLAAAMKTLKMPLLPNSKVMNACEEAVTPGVHAAELGGEVGRAFLIVIPGGPNSATCYGDNPGALFLLRTTKAGGFALIFSAQGYFAVLPTLTKGVHDIAIGGPGFEFPVYAWNGKTYVSSRTIKDSEMPAPLN